MCNGLVLITHVTCFSWLFCRGAWPYKYYQCYGASILACWIQSGINVRRIDYAFPKLQIPHCVAQWPYPLSVSFPQINSLGSLFASWNVHACVSYVHVDTVHYIYIGKALPKNRWRKLQCRVQMLLEAKTTKNISTISMILCVAFFSVLLWCFVHADSQLVKLLLIVYIN